MVPGHGEPASPMPLEAPVTTATLPGTSSIMAPQTSRSDRLPAQPKYLLKRSPPSLDLEALGAAGGSAPLNEPFPMRRWLLGLVVIVGATVGTAFGVTIGKAPPSGASPRCLGPRCLDAAVPLPAGVHVTDNHVRILLPVGYDRGSHRYPVLYLLHGAGDTYTAWTTKTDVTAFSAGFPVIIVMPDGGHNSLAGWYSDWFDGTYQWETYHLGVLRSWVDHHLRTIVGDDAIAGLSMGGFGAMSYAARHPGMFRAAASFSGAVDTQYGAPASGVVFDQLRSQYGTPNDQIWGNQLTNASTWAAHNPTALATRLAGTQLFVASGTGTPGGSQGEEATNPGGYALENGIFQMNLQFVRALDSAGVPHHDDFYLGGVHDWPYWQADLHWALPQMAALLRRPH